jgi:FkbM family methyltransferase
MTIFERFQTTGDADLRAALDRAKSSAFRVSKGAGRALWRGLREQFEQLRHGSAHMVQLEGTTLKFVMRDQASRNFFLAPHLWHGNLYESSTVKHLLPRLKASRCFIDVGANIGFYTLIASKLIGHGGQVHAIEMDQSNIARIRRTLSENHVRNVALHHMAIGDRDEMVHYRHRTSTTNSLSAGCDDAPGGLDQQVSMRKLDTFVEDHQLQPDIIKIDVEGADYLVASGMGRTLKRFRPKIYCELHAHDGPGSLWSFGHTPRDVLRFFERHDYRVLPLDLRDGLQLDVSELTSRSEITESIMIYCESRC